MVESFYRARVRHLPIWPSPQLSQVSLEKQIEGGEGNLVF